jgi:hypothetical protein
MLKKPNLLGVADSGFVRQQDVYTLIVLSSTDKKMADRLEGKHALLTVDVAREQIKHRLIACGRSPSARPPICLRSVIEVGPLSTEDYRNQYECESVG